MFGVKVQRSLWTESALKWLGRLVLLWPARFWPINISFLSRNSTLGNSLFVSHCNFLFWFLLRPPTTTTNMAELERAQKSLREIPYAVTAKLMRSMDSDKGWEDLGESIGLVLWFLDNETRVATRDCTDGEAKLFKTRWFLVILDSRF